MPYLRRGVVWRTSLCDQKAALASDFRDVKIAQFNVTSAGHEKVGTFNVPVHNVEFVQGFQGCDRLRQNLPALIFGDVGASAFAVFDFLLEITAISVLHYETE